MTVNRRGVFQNAGYGGMVRSQDLLVNVECPQVALQRFFLSALLVVQNAEVVQRYRHSGVESAQ